MKSIKQNLVWSAQWRKPQKLLAYQFTPITYLSLYAVCKHLFRTIYCFMWGLGGGLFWYGPISNHLETTPSSIIALWQEVPVTFFLFCRPDKVILYICMHRVILGKKQSVNRSIYCKTHSVTPGACFDWTPICRNEINVCQERCQLSHHH